MSVRETIHKVSSTVRSMEESSEFELLAALQRIVGNLIKTLKEGDMAAKFAAQIKQLETALDAGAMNKLGRVVGDVKKAMKKLKGQIKKLPDEAIDQLNKLDSFFVKG